jgi:hypothetical protein
MLRSLVLACHDNVGRQMGQTHRRVGLVHMLAAGAARPVSIDAQIVIVDFDFDIVVDLRINKHGSE